MCKIAHPVRGDFKPAVPSGSARMPLFWTIETARNRRSTASWVLKSSLNYLAHRKKGTVIITNRQFTPKFVQKQNWLNPSCKQHSSTLQNMQYLSAVQKLVNMCKLMIAIYLNSEIVKVSRENTLFPFWVLKLKAAHPEKLFSLIFAQIYQELSTQ